MTRPATGRRLLVELLGLRNEPLRGNRGLFEVLAGAAVEPSLDIVRVQLHPELRSTFVLCELDEEDIVLAKSRERDTPRAILASGDEKEAGICSNELPLGDFLER